MAFNQQLLVFQILSNLVACNMLGRSFAGEVVYKVTRLLVSTLFIGFASHEVVKSSCLLEKGADAIDY